MAYQRRRLLLTTAVTGTAGLAGCLDQFGDDDPDDGNGSDDDDDDPSDEDDSNGANEGSGDENGAVDGDGGPNDESGSETGDGDDDSEDGSGSDDDSEDSADEDETGDGDEDEVDDDDDGTDRYETDVAEGFVRGYWTEPYRTTVGEPPWEVFDSADEAIDSLDLEDRDGDVRRRLETLVDETDFDREHLVAIEAQGPNLCYRLELQTVSATDENGLTIEAAAVENRREGTVCGQAIVELGLLVRVAYEDDAEKPTDVSISVADGSRSGTDTN